MAEAENFQREAYEESVRRKKAEKDVIDAIRRVKFLKYIICFFILSYATLTKVIYKVD